MFLDFSDMVLTVLGHISRFGDTWGLGHCFSQSCSQIVFIGPVGQSDLFCQSVQSVQLDRLGVRRPDWEVWEGAAASRSASSVLAYSGYANIQPSMRQATHPSSQPASQPPSCQAASHPAQV